jgi:long-chain acyl-CoA synthetase
VGGTTVEEVVARFAAGRELKPETTLDELGLSSLDRVELMMALEDTFQVTLEEGALEASKNMLDLKALVQDSGVRAPTAEAAGLHRNNGLRPNALRGPEPSGSGRLAFPTWNRWPGAWFLRRISLPTWILPLARVFLELKVEGLEHLRGLQGPVIFASNHQSHMDTPTILIALPARWRYRVSTAMSREFFHAHFHRNIVGFKSWLTNSLNYFGACMFFNAFPMSQGGSGTRQTMRYIGDVTRDGYSVLIFPEGERRAEADGELAPFRAGVGMIGARLDLPVIPVRIEGLDKVLHKKMKWPKRGPVRVAFGAPVRLVGEDYPALAARVEDAVRRL